jgi:hypothetical protein
MMLPLSVGGAVAIVFHISPPRISEYPPGHEQDGGPGDCVTEAELELCGPAAVVFYAGHLRL